MLTKYEITVNKEPFMVLLIMLCILFASLSAYATEIPSPSSMLQFEIYSLQRIGEEPSAYVSVVNVASLFKRYLPQYSLKEWQGTTEFKPGRAACNVAFRYRRADNIEDSITVKILVASSHAEAEEGLLLELGCSSEVYLAGVECAEADIGDHAWSNYTERSMVQQGLRNLDELRTRPMQGDIVFSTRNVVVSISAKDYFNVAIPFAEAVDSELLVGSDLVSMIPATLQSNIAGIASSRIKQALIKKSRSVRWTELCNLERFGAQIIWDKKHRQAQALWRKMTIRILPDEDTVYLDRYVVKIPDSITIRKSHIYVSRALIEEIIDKTRGISIVRDILSG